MRIAEMFEVPEGPLLEQMRRNILHINGDAHRRLRNLVNPAFTPRAADRWRPGDARVPRAALGAARGRAAAASSSATFAKPYPSLTIATVMGAPLEDAPKLHEWSNLIQRQFDPPSLMNERDAIERACAEFYEWAGALIERRTDDPGDDLISTLIAAEQEGDRLSDVECMNLVLNVLVGGVDTTQSQLAHGLRVFAAHPDQWELLAERARARAGGGRGAAPLRADHAVHRAPAARGGRVPRRDVPRRHGRDGLLVRGQPRRRGGRSRGVRHHRRARRRQAAHVRRRHPLLPRARTWRAPSCRRRSPSCPQRMPGLALDGEPELGSIHGIYGLERLPLRWT